MIGAGAVAVYPALLEYQGMLMSEPLAATLLVGGVLAILWAGDGESLLRWLWPGALLGALALVRPEYLGVAALLSVVVFAHGAFARRLLGARSPRVTALWLESVVGASGGAPPRGFGGRGAVDDPQRGRTRSLRPDLHRRRPGAVCRHLPAFRRGPGKGRGRGGCRKPGLFQAGDAERLRLEQILAVLAADRYPGLETDKALSKMGREQLLDDVTEEPVEYAGFVATKVWRIWSHGPRDVMREPGWEIFHFALAAFGLVGLAMLAWRRRWEALAIGVVLLSITAVSALLVASPRRVLVMLPLVAALAGVGITWAAARVSDIGAPMGAEKSDAG